MGRETSDTDPAPGADGRELDGGGILDGMAQPPRPRRPDDRAIPLAPPVPRRLGEGPAAEPSSAGPESPLGPFALDPGFADAISRVISDAISAEMERVRVSLAPLPSTAPATPALAPKGDGKPPSEPPRSSIRIVAKKAPRWTSYVVTFLAIAGQLIVWFGPRMRDDLQGPLAQALELIGWLLSTLGSRIQ